MVAKHKGLVQMPAKEVVAASEAGEIAAVSSEVVRRIEHSDTPLRKTCLHGTGFEKHGVQAALSYRTASDDIDSNKHRTIVSNTKIETSATSRKLCSYIRRYPH